MKQMEKVVLNTEFRDENIPDYPALEKFLYNLYRYIPRYK